MPPAPPVSSPSPPERGPSRAPPGPAAGACGWRLAACLIALLVLGAQARPQSAPAIDDGDGGRGHRPSDVTADLTGYWSGAVVSGGSAQACSLTIAATPRGWQATAAVPEWPWAVFDPQPMVALDDGAFRVEMPYDEALLRLDPERRELLGTIDQGRRVLRVHLKRMLPPPPPRSSVDPVVVAGPAGRLCAWIIRPTAAGPGPFPTIVWVHGRGCWDGSGVGLRMRARALAEHGIASVVFDKRGTGGSEGSCHGATLEELVADVHAVVASARSQPGLDPARVGLVGSSAGAWVAIRAATTSAEPPAFVATLVGPATSVEEQQRDNARLIADDLALPDAERDRVERYLDLMFDASVPAGQAHAEMTALLEHARATGWIDFHDDSDIPDGPDGVAGLWVRRFRYDPTDDLRAWQGPFLALLGGRDRVVPARKHADRYEALFAAGGNRRATVRILPLANHGLWIPEQELDLGGGVTGFGFSRPAAGALEELPAFLRREGLLDDAARPSADVGGER